MFSIANLILVLNVLFRYVLTLGNGLTCPAASGAPMLKPITRPLTTPFGPERLVFAFKMAGESTAFNLEA
jgi:hypothetical protein